MAAGTLYSTEYDNAYVDVPPTNNPPNKDGKLYRKYFSGTVSGTDVAVGTKIYLCKLPKGARFTGGLWYNDGTFAGASVTLDIGHAGDPNGFAAAIDVSGENATAFPNTAAVAGGANGLGAEMTAETAIYATNAVDVIVATGTYKGYIDYLLS